MKSTRIYILAKELGVKSSDIIKKCHFEGEKLVTIKNHMSPVSDDVASAIRMWFTKEVDELNVYNK